MINQLKEIIIDFQTVTLFTGVQRELVITPVTAKATVCIGVRRSGKSTLMNQIIQKLFEQGVYRENILYLNFFDERLHQLYTSGLNTILEAYFSLYPNKKNTEKIYCFFDEIQIIPGWEPFIDRIMRTENCEVYITGSSAQLLSKEIATQMRGRALSWEMFPFSFSEFLDYKQLNYKNPYSTKTRFLLQNAFNDYWETGGFPEVLSLDKHLRIKILQEYYNSTLFRDMIERHNVTNPKAILDLARWLIDNNAALFSINNLTGYLKSLGHRITKSTVSDYIDWFEDAYFFFNVKIFDSSLNRVNSNPKKIYCIDHAMVNATSSGIMVNSGRLLENIVFISLRRITSHIFYYKTKDNYEVDFIAQLEDRSRLLIQVCESLVDTKTRKREITALNKAMLELKINKGIIVTRNEEEILDLEAGKIEIISAWRFFLYISKHPDI
jgi:predicted AAA+ superfamily ATPase